MDVFQTEIQFTACKWNKLDSKENHATMYKGAASGKLRHNEVRNIVGKASIEIEYWIKNQWLYNV